MSDQNQYTEDNRSPLRLERTHSYASRYVTLGRLSDGSSPDDGIYILLKEVMDNCIEFVMGLGKRSR
jgi:topoisomerase-4 subunit B